VFQFGTIDERSFHEIKLASV